MTVESWNTLTFFNINWTGIFYIDIFICEGIESFYYVVCNINTKCLCVSKGRTKHRFADVYIVHKSYFFIISIVKKLALMSSFRKTLDFVNN